MKNESGTGLSNVAMIFNKKKGPTLSQILRHAIYLSECLETGRLIVHCSRNMSFAVGFGSLLALDNTVLPRLQDRSKPALSLGHQNL